MPEGSHGENGENESNDALASDFLPQVELPPEIREQLQELLRSLPEDRRTTLVRVISSVSHYSGPTPPPDILAKYEQILPGSADRSFRMAEDNADHRRTWENSILRINEQGQKRRDWMTFALAVIALSGAVYAGQQGYAISFGLLIYALSGIALRFIRSIWPSSEG